MKAEEKRLSKLVWLSILPFELSPKTAREKRWADFPDNFFGFFLRKFDFLSCFGLWMRFFQQCQVKVRDQKPLSCTKTNKTYFSKLPSTYFFIGSQMEGFRGSSTYIVRYFWATTTHTRGLKGTPRSTPLHRAGLFLLILDNKKRFWK